MSFCHGGIVQLGAVALLIFGSWEFAGGDELAPVSEPADRCMRGVFSSFRRAPWP